MFYLVISSPELSKPAQVKKERLKFRSWVKELESIKKIISFFPRVGRGSVVIFDVSSNDELHALLTEWTNIIPACFDIYPLASPIEAERLLK